VASYNSPPIAVADATPWLWRGNATNALEYQIRFYATSKAVDELAQGGDRTVTITDKAGWFYEDEQTTTDSHTSTLAGTAPELVAGGVWTVLGTGLGRSELEFVAVQSTEPAGGTFYRILVRTR
jgi:hypothetical protein